MCHSTKRLFLPKCLFSFFIFMLAVVPIVPATMFGSNLITLVSLSLVALSGQQIPDCFFHDTVDLTGHEKFPNSSYNYQGVIIPPNLIAEYDYEELYNGVLVKVKPHMRGCICKLKTCVQLCCPHNGLKNKNQRTCENSLDEINYPMNVPLINTIGQTEVFNITGDFVRQEFMPCSSSEGLNDTYNWKLFKNGTITFSGTKSLYLFNKSAYCMAPFQINDKYKLVPHVCLSNAPYTDRDIIIYTCMKVSVFFYCVTIFVYCLLPSFRNRFGKCLILYCVSMLLSFCVFVYTQECESLSVSLCQILGFFNYFSVISAFLWLSVISFDVWTHLHAKNLHMLRYRLLLYCLYSFGVAAVMTVLAVIAEMSSINENLKPGIDGEACMIDVKRIGSFFYFHGPLLIIILFNSFMFISIYRQIKQSSKMFSKEADGRRVGKATANFKVFLRLFFLMGILWIAEIVSYFMQVDLVTDYILAAQGIFMFILLVCKRSVWIELKNRMCCRKIEQYNGSDEEVQEGLSEMLPMQIFGNNDTNIRQL